MSETCEVCGAVALYRVRRLDRLGGDRNFCGRHKDMAARVAKAAHVKRCLHSEATKDQCAPWSFPSTATSLSRSFDKRERDKEYRIHR